MNAPLAPPIARRGPDVTRRFGLAVPDPYRWLRDPAYPQVKDPEILAYLEAENSWFRHVMAPVAPLEEALFAELKGRVPDEDESVPYADGDFLYWWTFEPGAQYRQWWRRRRAGGPPELMLSEPALAEGRAYFRLGALAVSPDGRWLAWSFDATGEERFELRIRDLASGRDIVTVAEDSVGGVAWSADSQDLAWAQASHEWRPDRVRLHRLGSAPGSDPVLYREEADFWVSVATSQDRRWLLITASQPATSEVRLVPADAPFATPRLVRPRQTGVRYQVDSGGGRLVVLANDTHPNFRLALASPEAPDRWETLLQGSDRLYLTGVTPFASYLAVEEKADGLERIRLMFPNGRSHFPRLPEEVGSVALGTNAEPDAAQLRLVYSSMVSPETVFDYDVATDRLVTRKVQRIPSGYDPGLYVTERLMAPARDGVQVPVTLLMRRDHLRDGSRPLHVYGYAAYGYGLPPSFSSTRLSLVDRGFAYALIHARGGDDLGYTWYLDGKLERKINSFHDFIDATRFLHGAGFGRPEVTSASGGSAGGWLMGLVATWAPQLYRAVVAHVPFVDVLNTMLDETLPLTPGEWPEWGDPRTDEAAFRRLLELSPYDQVRRQDYPALLVTAGIADPRVTYWEPAKWVARLRAESGSRNPILLKTNMEAGHGGRSGRYERLREVAEEYAFILSVFDGRLGRP
ncbi:MAG: S9 family peptidase [Sphingomonadaceae bacterium]|uniref:S9 family peptidase n=1 Tax=Thermaurantiacus sp. TaxID=2820283 RepID=UPI00298F1F6B|nr:S9 family peptidase [Thermaurantiacus sp.]MCS6987256.1 S9 family peptidase [Sphingomonadaceae bacterium]MDW8414476.1 S9 family peptidase [Thermaurantiacus sp.]